MSKERLEEIEAKYSILTVSSEKNGTEYTEVDVEDLVFLIQNGFKQVERVEELENEYQVRQIEYLEEHIDRLEKQNKRYREAIGEIRELLRGITDSILQDEVDEIIKELEGE